MEKAKPGKKGLENFVDVAGDLGVQSMTKQKDKVQQADNLVEPSNSCNLYEKYCGTEVSLRIHK